MGTHHHHDCGCSGWGHFDSHVLANVQAEQCFGVINDNYELMYKLK